MKADIEIRVATESDARELLAIYAPYVEETAVSFEYTVPSEEEFAERIRNTLKKYPYYVAVLDGKVVGYTYAGPFHAREAYAWGVETSIYVKKDMRGNRIGRELYSKLESTLKEMGILNMNACIAYPQKEDEYLTKDSERFHERMGFVKVAESHMCGFKFNRWYNMIWMEKMIGKHTENPMPVKRFQL